jgi:acetyl coenzyme A synthetase (ADP forming)-like protein
MSTPSRSRHGLDAIFRPSSVAVVGASRKRGTIAGELFHNLVSGAYPGAVYPVNAHAKVVQSVRAYPAVTAIPDPVDLAVLVVPRTEVLACVDECAKKGVHGLVVVTAGFGETGPAGKTLELELARRVRAAGMRMVGPNCFGVLNGDPALSLNATFAPRCPPFGPIAFSSQSGALGQTILDHARDLGLGMSQFASIGNKADVSGNDLLEYWEADPSVRVILMYLESFGNPRRFLEIASRVSRKKPILAVKAGRTEAGARAVASHTGALVGREIAVDALLGQAGVVRTDTIHELFDLALLLAHQPVPRGPRVAILTNAGGPGIMASDACESRGLSVAPLSGAAMEALRVFLPPEASLRNPVDMIASASAEAYERAVRILVGEEGVDAVLVLFVPPIMTRSAAVAEAIRRAVAGARKPVVTCFMGFHGLPEELSPLREAQVPSYAFPEAAALALARAVRHGRWLERPIAPPAEPPRRDLGRARAAVGQPSATEWLEPGAAQELLESYGIRCARARVAADPDNAARAALRIGLPVALKAIAPGLVHKSDVGGVRLGLSGADAVREAAALMAERLGRAPVRFLVQEMVPGGVEAFAGVTRDPAFGPILAFGAGGVAVEIWRDVVLRVLPIAEADAREMVESIRGARLFHGFRGAPLSDVDALVDALLRVGQMALDLPEIRELDLNPLLVLPRGRGVVAVDARIRVSRSLSQATEALRESGEA